MTREAMTRENVPFVHPSKSFIFKMHEVLWADELERIGMGVGKSFEQDHTFMTGREGEVLSWYRLPL